MWMELRRFAKSVAQDRAVRVILLAGDETVFSSGADIREFSTLRGPGATRAYDDLVESALRALEAVPQPTMACIAGPCVGAGASLACSCDIRIAANDAYFMVPAGRLGLGYDPRGIARFVRVFGDSVVRGLILGGQRCDARAAHACGAVHQPCDAWDRVGGRPAHRPKHGRERASDRGCGQGRIGRFSAGERWR